jgi:hypothetical protein
MTALRFIGMPENIPREDKVKTLVEECLALTKRCREQQKNFAALSKRMEVLHVELAAQDATREARELGSPKLGQVS